MRSCSWQPQADGGVPVGNEGGQAGRVLMEHPHFVRAGEVALDRSVERLWPGGRRFGVPAIVADRGLSLEHGLYGCNLHCSRRTPEHRVPQFLSRELRKPHYYSLFARSEMLPSAENRVFATGERDASGLHRPAARCVLDARDFLNVEMTLRILGDELIRSNRGRLRVNNDQIYNDVRGGGHTLPLIPLLDGGAALCGRDGARTDTPVGVGGGTRDARRSRGCLRLLSFSHTRRATATARSNG